jgi:hypothetical protein
MKFLTLILSCIFTLSVRLSAIEYEYTEIKKTNQEVFSTCFSKFEYLYFKPRSSTFFTLGEGVKTSKSINISDKRGYCWKEYNAAYRFREIPFTILGSTVLVLERNCTPEHSTHFFHFLEHLLGIWNFFGEENCHDVRLFVLCGNGRGFIKNWKGENDVTYHLARALFPNAEILEWTEFTRQTQNKIVCFEKAIISDRSMEIFKTEPYLTDRMLGGYFEDLKQERLDHFASRIWNYCQVAKVPTDKIVVTYVRRTGSRCLTSSCEEELISKIEKLENVDLRIVDFAAISFYEQVKIIVNTDVLLGVHGNGLSHALLLPSGATVIELFPKDSFRVEYRIIAKSRGLNYFGWIDSVGWVSDEVAESVGYYGNVAVDKVNTHVDAIMGVLQLIHRNF